MTNFKLSINFNTVITTIGTAGVLFLCTQFWNFNNFKVRTEQIDLRQDQQINEQGKKCEYRYLVNMEAVLPENRKKKRE